MKRILLLTPATALFLLASTPILAQAVKESVPEAAAIAVLLETEPFSLESWPAWRARLLTWIHDRSRKADAAYNAARSFLRSQADANGELPPALSKDYFAWYGLGSAYLYEQRANADPTESAKKAEQALRHSLQLEPGFARGHRHLALAILMQTPRDQANPRADEVDRELAEAARLDPSLPLNFEKGTIAAWRVDYVSAERFYEADLKQFPDAGIAQTLALVVLQDRNRAGPRAPRIKQLTEQFPDSGDLASFHSLALAMDNDLGGAYRELQRARSLGADPEKLLGPKLVEEITSRGGPGWPERFGWIMLYFVAFYAAVMLGMAVVGLVLAGRTRGSRALDLLQEESSSLVEEGQVARVGGESLLAKLCALALCVGLVLFYASIPFIIIGLLGTTALLVYLIFMAGRIPVKLVIIVVVFGLGAAWAVFKSLFTKPAEGSFGIPKSATDCPGVHQALAEVAKRVDTDPVDEMFVAPGSEIGVHQTGRGPFGIFGVKRRVLTLGLSTMRFLTVSELKAILAHEYAHFSHRDTFYSRFIYQVHLSIGQALWGMGSVGGTLNYVNPFYWFMYLYYKSYSLLSAGFSRSREFLADRMASSLYGSDVFASALTKVSTDGLLFEKTMWDSVADQLEKQQAFANVYDAFHHYRDRELTEEQREAEYENVMAEKGSLFAQHPTIAERMEAVAGLPTASQQDQRPALELFDNPEETERELTQFLTDYVHSIRQMQAAAAAQAASQ